MVICFKRVILIRYCLKKNSITYIVEGTYYLLQTQGARSAYSL